VGEQSFRPDGEPPFGLFSEAQVETEFEDTYRRIEDGRAISARISVTT
jgi:hypothetical protein